MSGARSRGVRRIPVVIFCGGRGGSRIIREFLRHPGVELTALINAYDDGFSTGELRALIPGMLGPSDFRKNLASFLHWHSSHQFALTQLLEFRFSRESAVRQIERVKAWARGPATNREGLPEPLRQQAHELRPAEDAVRGFLTAFFAYQDVHGGDFDFADCSMGNLIFAGAFLKNGSNFNAAADELARVFQSQARLLNISRGENRVLVAIKEDGEILENETSIVGAQSATRIAEIFLLEQALTAEQLALLKREKGCAARAEILQAWHRPVMISTEARAAILDASLIIYGPGTQFSSLMPSYTTLGLPEALAQSPAAARIFVTNVHRDHDIEAFSAPELVATALRLLSDPKNEHRTITHVLANSISQTAERQLRKAVPEEGSTPALRWIQAALEDPLHPGAHSGFQTVRAMLKILEEAQSSALPELDIYINLYRRSLAAGHLVQEFVELPWNSYFEKVRLRLNQVAPLTIDLPVHLSIETVDRSGMFSEVEELAEWAGTRNTRYLVTLSGDGQYRLGDIFLGMEVLTQHSFAAVYGSRTQSRNQFYNSLDAAYGESLFLYLLSLAGGFLFSFLYVLRFGVIFSDPLTGFRLYNRSALGQVRTQLAALGGQSASGITRVLMEGGCEVAEIPVTYRTFRGFTDAKWRLRRSFRNAWQIFFAA